MMILEKILQQKQREVERLQNTAHLKQLRQYYEEHSEQWRKKRPFAECLSVFGEVPHLIAELKKASPSKGVIRENFSATELAMEYDRGGAAALSVLTDQMFFQGEPQYLTLVRDTVGLPLLRKDFIISEEQVEESLYLGADAILLIVSALDVETLQALRYSAGEKSLDVLVEVHDESELEQALKINPDLIGINNRDLRTFETDLSTTERLATRVPTHIPLVGESGIQDFNDVKRLSSYGVRAVLVGESLMRQGDVQQAVRNLLGRD